MTVSLVIAALLIVGDISANLLSVLLFLGQAVISIIGWYLLASRQNTKETSERMASLERFRDKTIGWVKGAFGVNLNGD